MGFRCGCAARREVDSVPRSTATATCFTIIVAAAILVTTPPGRAQTAQVPIRAPKPILLPEANRIPDANERMEMQNQKAQDSYFTAANLERKRQLDQDSDLLVRLTKALKVQMDDKEGKNIAPADAIREIEIIERLAHAVKEKMKLTVVGVQ